MPCITETLISWGVVPVGVTRFCDVEGVPAVGGTKTPDLPAIRNLRPDVVLMDREENRREDAQALEAAGIAVVATAVRDVAGVAGALRSLAAACAVVAPPTRPSLPSTPSTASAPRVYVPIWRRPWMTIGGGTYGSSLLALAGLDNVFANHPGTYPELSPGEAAARHPDWALLPSEPYPFKERHRPEVEHDVGAPTVLVDGRDLFWWGERTGAALERLRRLAARLAGA